MRNRRLRALSGASAPPRSPDSDGRCSIRATSCAACLIGTSCGPSNSSKNAKRFCVRNGVKTKRQGLEGLSVFYRKCSRRKDPGAPPFRDLSHADRATTSRGHRSTSEGHTGHFRPRTALYLRWQTSCDHWTSVRAIADRQEPSRLARAQFHKAVMGSFPVRLRPGSPFPCNALPKGDLSPTPVLRSATASRTGSGRVRPFLLARDAGCRSGDATLSPVHHQGRVLPDATTQD